MWNSLSTWTDRRQCSRRRQLEELRQTDEVFGVLGAGWMLGAKGDVGRAVRNRARSSMPIEFVGNDAEEPARGPPFERCTNGVTVKNKSLTPA